MRGNRDLKRMKRTPRGSIPAHAGNRAGKLLSTALGGSIPAHAGQPADKRRDFRLCGVYPRACGATLCGSDAGLGYWGLSPRMRGNPFFDSVFPADPGSIPAHAGQPDRPARGRCEQGVYPRACGATLSRLMTHSSRSGLSPRVRGNRPAYRPQTARSGSIPARAGQPSVDTARYADRWVYPRACGATRNNSRGGRLVEGLSPRVRGNHFSARYIRLPYGSIPARAGQPADPSANGCVPGVYPRACGATPP